MRGLAGWLAYSAMGGCVWIVDCGLVEKEEDGTVMRDGCDVDANGDREE